MNDNRTPTTVGQILDNLPPPLSEADLRSCYGDSMEYVRTLVHDAISRHSAADVAIASVRRAGTAVLRVLDHAADIVTEALQPLPAPAFASRALGGASSEVSGAAHIRVSRKSETCRLAVSVETSNGGQNLRVSLQDTAGRSLTPMLLTVGDAESGETLLSEKIFASGEALLRDVEPGEYAILAECGDNGANMTIRIEAQPR